MSMLELHDVTAGFGAVTVLHGVTMVVQQGEIAGVFGLNGAGKSVTLKTVAGIVPARSGQIVFDGVDITRLDAETRVEMGMGHVPQGRQVFANLTVEENLRLGAYTLRRKQRSRYAAALDGVYDRYPVLRERRAQRPGTMSGGQQPSLSVARAHITEPRLVL
ncbi:MAG: branched-chain amino acid transport system ATP-binding protein, partial [Frankiales bacterium]|nr:branched-chain amino acid transport system ATP-binding protein [Frankiales bacterium]